MATYIPSDNLRAAREAERAAKDAYDKALERLYDAIAAELVPPVKAADIGRYLGYHAGHVTRIGRDRGVKPTVIRKPPGRPKPADVEG